MEVACRTALPARPTLTVTQRPPQDDKRGAESGFESGAFEALESDFQEVCNRPVWRDMCALRGC